MSDAHTAITHVTPADGNVFADLGLEDAPDLWLRSQLLIMLKRRIEELGLSQSAVGRRLGISQPAVAAMLRDPVKSTVGRLLHALGVFDAHFSLEVRPDDQGHFCFVLMEPGQPDHRCRIPHPVAQG